MQSKPPISCIAVWLLLLTWTLGSLSSAVGQYAEIQIDSLVLSSPGSAARQLVDQFALNAFKREALGPMLKAYPQTKSSFYFANKTKLLKLYFRKQQDQLVLDSAKVDPSASEVDRAVLSHLIKQYQSTLPQAGVDRVALFANTQISLDISREKSYVTTNLGKPPACANPGFITIENESYECNIVNGLIKSSNYYNNNFDSFIEKSINSFYDRNVSRELGDEFKNTFDDGSKECESIIVTQTVLTDSLGNLLSTIPESSFSNNCQYKLFKYMLSKGRFSVVRYRGKWISHLPYRAVFMYSRGFPEIRANTIYSDLHRYLQPNTITLKSILK